MTNATNMTSTEGDTANVTQKASDIITVIINSIACPFTVLLNVLVIMAVKRIPRLHTKSNILLACLAATDALTGLIVQPSFILWKISLFVGTGNSEGILNFQNSSLFTALYSSSLHLMLVTFERLLAIKFTMRYLNVITEKNIKRAVTVFWIIAFTFGVFRLFRFQVTLVRRTLAVVVISCILFVVLSYVILYRETRRHKKKIKTQQLPQEEVERFTKENKALLTTVYVVGAVILCLLLVIIPLLFSKVLGPQVGRMWEPWIRTCGMVNSLLNPLIYCWRQKEMRKFVFRMKNQVVHPVNQWRRVEKEGARNTGIKNWGEKDL